MRKVRVGQVYSWEGVASQYLIKYINMQNRGKEIIWQETVLLTTGQCALDTFDGTFNYATLIRNPSYGLVFKRKL